MIEMNIEHGHPIIVSSNGKYKQRIHLWVDNDGIINHRMLPIQNSEDKK